LLTDKQNKENLFFPPKDKILSSSSNYKRQELIGQEAKKDVYGRLYLIEDF